MDNIELYNKIDEELINNKEPSNYLKRIISELNKSKYPLKLLGELTYIEQEPKYHPEGSVWNHTLLVVDRAAKYKDKSEDPRAFMWGALLHDIGKIKTTRVRKGRITSYDHDKFGAIMAEEFLKFFNEDNSFIKKVKALVRWHMQPLFVIKNLPFADIKNMVEDIDPKEIYFLSLCDRMGRGRLNSEKEKGIIGDLDRFMEEIANFK